jgi:hypothetical protein
MPNPVELPTGFTSNFTTCLVRAQVRLNIRLRGKNSLEAHRTINRCSMRGMNDCMYVCSQDPQQTCKSARCEAIDEEVGNMTSLSEIPHLDLIFFSSTFKSVYNTNNINNCNRSQLLFWVSTPACATSARGVKYIAQFVPSVHVVPSIPVHAV